MGDEDPAMFTNPLFKWLGVRYARLSVPWDVIRYPYELSQASTWLSDAKKAGVQPLVAFDRSVVHPRELPSLGTYSHAVGAFLRLFPWVKEYEPWNEENQAGEPTASNPKRAAEYYNWLSRACQGCSVTAADLLDGPSIEGWLKRFLPNVHNAQLWGLHPYFEMTNGGEQTLSRFIALTHGQIWLTEAGTPIWRFIRAKHSFHFSTSRQEEQDTTRLLTMISRHDRISGVYYYQWRSPTTLATAEAQLRHHERVIQTWDSGVLDPSCSIRPAFEVLARAVGLNPAKAPKERSLLGHQECVLALS
jgi:hypothetical protein